MIRLSRPPKGDPTRGATRVRSGLGIALMALLLLAAGCAPIAPTPPAPGPAAGAGAETQAPAAVPPPTEDLAKLRANSWQWVAIEGGDGRAEIKNPAAYRLTFNTDATLGVAADCASAVQLENEIRGTSSTKIDGNPANTLPAIPHRIERLCAITFLNKGWRNRVGHRKQAAFIQNSRALTQCILGRWFARKD